MDGIPALHLWDLIIEVVAFFFQLKGGGVGDERVPVGVPLHKCAEKPEDVLQPTY